MKRPSLPRGLYAIADAAERDPVADGLRILAAGCPVVQLRAKGWGTRRIADAARELVVAAPAGAVVMVNDDVEAAAIAGAHGVHLGQDDGEIRSARRLLGPRALVGRSTHDLQQLDAAVEEGADYVGFGPVFSTTTKADTEAVVGLSGLAAAAAHSPVPVVAIGGITAARIPAVRASGAHGWALISALAHALRRGPEALDRLR